MDNSITPSGLVLLGLLWGSLGIILIASFWIAMKRSRIYRKKHKFNSVADRVIIRPMPADDKIGSIEVLESAKRPRKGIIIGIGPDCKVATIDDTALYQKGAGAELEIEGENIIFMRESDLLATIPK